MRVCLQRAGWRASQWLASYLFFFLPLRWSLPQLPSPRHPTAGPAEPTPTPLHRLHLPLTAEPTESCSAGRHSEYVSTSFFTPHRSVGEGGPSAEPLALVMALVLALALALALALVLALVLVLVLFQQQ